MIIITIMISASKNGMDESEMLIVGVLEWISVMFSVSGFGVAVIGEGAIDMERIFVHISLILNLIGMIYHGFVVYFGFIERIRGDHYIYSKDGVDEIINIQPVGNKSKAYQVKQVRNLIHKYKLGGSDNV